MKIKSLKDCHLYGILDQTYLGNRDPTEVALDMMKGSVDIIQIRAKNISKEDLKRLALRVLPVTRKSGVPLVINDHPDVAVEIGVDGVHVGQDDMSIERVKNIVGENMFVGRSTHSLEQAIAAEREGADYIGVGPIFSTPTKPDYKEVGLALIGKVKEIIKIPFYCIGGIKVENADLIVQSGASRFVVVSGILQAENIPVYCQKLRGILSYD